MKIKQKLSDILLLLKSERRYQLVAGGIICAVLFLVISGPGKRPGAGNAKAPKHQKKSAVAKKVQATAKDEAYTDIVAALDQSQKALVDKVDKIGERVEETNKRVDENQERTAEIFKKILERIADQEVTGQNMMPAGADMGQPGGAGPEPMDITADESAMGAVNVSMEDNNLESFGDMAPREAPPIPPSQPNKVAFIGAGDSVTVKLIAGVRAPTDGTPYPVLFKLVGDVQGPDGSTLPLGEARLVAAAQGSLTDSRVLFRLTKLNLRLPNGRRKVLDVDGWVVGEDGMRGMQGISIDPIGKGIAAAGMIGSLQAVGEGLARSTTSNTRDAFGATSEIITGDLGTYAAGKGASGFSQEWGKIVAQRVKELVPHVEVYSGREGTAVFAQSLAIRDLYEALDSEESDVFTD